MNLPVSHHDSHRRSLSFFGLSSFWKLIGCYGHFTSHLSLSLLVLFLKPSPHWCSCLDCYIMTSLLSLVRASDSLYLSDSVIVNVLCAGLSLVVGLVLYISSINDEVMNRPREPEQFFNYYYGWSFAFAASSFLLKEVSPDTVCNWAIKEKSLCIHTLHALNIYCNFFMLRVLFPECTSRQDD